MNKTKFVGVYSRPSEGDRMFGRTPDNCFYIVYRKEGRLIWEKVGWQGEGYSPKVANEIRAERLRQIRHGQELPKERKKVPRFSEISQEYYEWAKKNKAKPKNDYYLLHKYLWRFLGDKRMDEITSFDLERLKNELNKKQLSLAYIKHALILIRQIYNKAFQWGLYKGENPIKGVKLPTLNNARVRFLTHEEANALLAGLARVSSSFHDMALLSLHCGLRAGEIFNLRAQDLDFQNGLIRIMDPKIKPSRVAYMTEAVKEMLKARLPKDPGGLIFRDRWHGEKIRFVSKTFDRVIDSLGFNKGIKDPRQKVVFHSLRHTFASWLAIQGSPLLTISKLMGHRSLAMVQRYAHLSPDSERAEIIQLERNFNHSRNERVISVVQGKENALQ